MVQNRSEEDRWIDSRVMVLRGINPEPKTPQKRWLQEANDIKGKKVRSSSYPRHAQTDGIVS